MGGFFLFRFWKRSKENGPDSVGGLSRLVGHRFRDPDLLVRSLTHRSFEADGTRKTANERLEFLGDAVLDLVVTEALYRRRPEWSEGDLTQARSTIVNRDTLAERAKANGLGKHIFLGASEERSGGRKRDSILADAFEAVIGAIYLDGGIKPASKFVLIQLASHIDRALADVPSQNFKSRLLEYVQARSGRSPKYELVNEEGPDHRKVFTMAVRVEGKIVGEGQGPNKKKAEQEAAREAIKKLGLAVKSR
jgi:ribonuclease III